MDVSLALVMKISGVLGTALVFLLGLHRKWNELQQGQKALAETVALLREDVRDLNKRLNGITDRNI